MKAFVILIGLAGAKDYLASDIESASIDEIRELAKMSEEIDDRCGEMDIKTFQNSFNYDLNCFYNPDDVYIRFA